MGGAVAQNHPIAGAAVGGAIAGGGRKLGPVVNGAVGAVASDGHPVAGEWIISLSFLSRTRVRTLQALPIDEPPL